MVRTEVAVNKARKDFQGFAADLMENMKKPRTVSWCLGDLVPSAALPARRQLLMSNNHWAVLRSMYARKFRRDKNFKKTPHAFV